MLQGQAIKALWPSTAICYQRYYKAGLKDPNSSHSRSVGMFPSKSLVNKYITVWNWHPGITSKLSSQSRSWELLGKWADPQIEWLANGPPRVWRILVVLPAATCGQLRLLTLQICFPVLSRHPLLPSCCLLCLPLEVALFRGVETSSQIATAPRRGAHYVPPPREVSGQGRGLCSVGQCGKWSGVDLGIASAGFYKV